MMIQSPNNIEGSKNQKNQKFYQAFAFENIQRNKEKDTSGNKKDIIK